MKAILYVFSGTGNTFKCANLFKAEFEKAGVPTDIYRITSTLDDMPDPRGADYVGIGFPVHGFNAPSIMNEFIDALPSSDCKEYFFFRTSGEPLKLNDGASAFIETRLKRKGYKKVGEYGYVMPYNMIFRHEDGMASLMYSEMKKRVPKAVKELTDGSPSAPERPFGGKAVSAVLLIEHPAMKVNGRMFSVNKDKCIGCMKCVKNCPTENIVYDGEKFVFGGDCLMCARCSFNCPTDAFNIAMLNGWRVNGKYDFDAEPRRQQGAFSWYCKGAYDRYFSEEK